jgi:hypothetical protein
VNTKFKKQQIAALENYWWKLKLNSRRNKKFRFGKRHCAKFSRPFIVLRI